MAFIHEDFLLKNRPARQLFHEYAEEMPLLDYHCHLPASYVAENRRFGSITEAWLGGDHYKWRVMRANGVDESYITGEKNDWEKFLKWAETVPATLGNPLYHWTHLELARFFDIDDILLNPDTAREIYDQCNILISGENFKAREIMRRMKVKAICTTDDPADSLEHHEAIAQERGLFTRVYPALRPDKAHALEKPEQFNLWVERLEETCGTAIHSYDQFLQALEDRHDFFHEHGCRLSDHGIERPAAEPFTRETVASIFLKVRSGTGPTDKEIETFRSAMLLEFGRMNAKRGWTMQLHMAAYRGVNSRMMEQLGPDTGFDSIGDFEIAKPLGRFLDTLEREGNLPKMIFYSLNPNHLPIITTMAGNFQDGSIPGKMQIGSAWWYNDQIDGMEQQMKTLANMGLLSRFVGMLTDSRSFLSYPRHEYFRRVLCNMIGEWVENGEVPHDVELLGKMVQDICYNNAVAYFNLPDIDTDG